MGWGVEWEGQVVFIISGWVRVWEHFLASCWVCLGEDMGAGSSLEPMEVTQLEPGPSDRHSLGQV